mgnify:CR=1 FL=1
MKTLVFNETQGFFYGVINKECYVPIFESESFKWSQSAMLCAHI